MSLLKEIFRHEVYPALGCTEPTACAYATSLAAETLGERVTAIEMYVDPGTFKNGAAVTVPHSDGAKGNLAAAALGAMLARSEAKLELLRDVTPDILANAHRLLESGRCWCECADGVADFMVDVTVRGRKHDARCVLYGSHTHIERMEKDGRKLQIAEGDAQGPDAECADEPVSYREELRKMDLASLLALAERIDDDDHDLMRRGIEMNLHAAEHGLECHRTAWQLSRMYEQGFLADDIFRRAKLMVASAVDARMAGAEYPIMTSGGSGNQGIVAILTSTLVGREFGVDEARIKQSLALAHLMNAYIKCFMGELAAICGCAMAASMAASAAIVYQKEGLDMDKIAMAVNNVVSDLGGLICDGAKPGCAMKAVTGVDTAIRSALMAIGSYGPAPDEGVVGMTAEDSIRNLARLTLEGMFEVDPTVLRIIEEKAVRAGMA